MFVVLHMITFHELNNCILHLNLFLVIMHRNKIYHKVIGQWLFTFIRIERKNGKMCQIHLIIPNRSPYLFAKLFDNVNMSA